MTQQVEGREAQGERKRPRLTVTRVALGGQVSERQGDVVPVRPDEGDTTFDLAGPLELERLMKGLLELVALRNLARGDARRGRLRLRQ